MNYEFDTKDLVCLALSSVVGVWYLLRKVREAQLGTGLDGHRLISMQGGGSMYSRTQISFSCPSQHWIANNLFGLAFSLNGVELLHLNNVSTGCILLGGLFIYDVFWVSWEHSTGHWWKHVPGILPFWRHHPGWTDT